MPDLELAGFEELEHTADWSLRVWAPDLAGLLEQAARGMQDLCGIRIASDRRELRSLRVEATDAEGLLVSFLGELLHIAEEEWLAFDTFELSVSESMANARLEGGPIVEQKKEIKAVTYHNLVVEKKSTGLQAVLVFDV
ncbi:MAG: archease [Anaerolineales bacterium]